jgi:predicted  nucleic acid-binding Zn-ribbon protein
VVTADPAVQLRLLDVQAIDTALAQLAHKRRTLPEISVIADASARLQVLHSDVVSLQTELSDISGEQRRLENDIDVVRTRETRDQQRLQSGGIPAKELEGLQHELQSLARRQATLEDATLEVMEKREGLETSLAAITAKHSEISDSITAAEAARNLSWTQIDAEAETKSLQRQTTATQIPADLLSLYDKVRLAQGGIGAAALRQRRCEGCRLEQAGSELSRIRQAEPDEVLRCENCRRILIRTPESGL